MLRKNPIGGAIPANPRAAVATAPDIAAGFIIDQQTDSNRPPAKAFFMGLQVFLADPAPASLDPVYLPIS
jgi:hypothetical protein